MPVSRWSTSRSRSVLTIQPFRRLWIALGFTTLGEWIGLLATVGFAASVAAGSYSFTNFAVAGVLLLWLLPGVVSGPLGDYLAARIDRRWTLIVGNLLRCGLFASIPYVGNLAWLYVAILVSAAVGVVWRSTESAERRMRAGLPPERLESAERLSRLTTYLGAIPAAIGFAGLVLIDEALTATLGWFWSPVDLALYTCALMFLLAALVTARRPADDESDEVERAELESTEPEPAEPAESTEPTEPAEPQEDPTVQPSGNVLQALARGRQALGGSRDLRRIVIAMAGAFSAAGVMVGIGRIYIADLGAADAGFGVLFTALSLGVVIGVLRGPRLLTGLSRRRRIGLALTGAGLLLLCIALGHSRTLVVLLTAVLGLLAGIAWAHGRALLAASTDPGVGPRTLEFAESVARLVLLIVIPGAPALAGAIGPHAIELPGGNTVQYDGAAIAISAAALLVIVLGVLSYKLLDDQEGVPLMRDLRAALGDDRGVFADRGLFVAFEGGEGSGKSTQASILAEWLSDRDYDVVLTHQPGATEIGQEIRQLVLHRPRDYMSARTEALLYAADKAEHVDTIVRPALERGAAVITDRYIDSALAYQGGGRELDTAEVRLISRWATRGLQPQLTVLLDIPPEVGLTRIDGDGDRLEQETLEFHQSVRQHFLELAAADPDRYVVVDALQATSEIAARIRARVEPMLPGVRLRASVREG